MQFFACALIFVGIQFGEISIASEDGSFLGKPLRPPVVEPIPPATLFTDPKEPGVRLNLSLPSELAPELTAFTKAMWQELMRDIALCGVDPFLELYRKGFLTGPLFKREYPLTRWNLFLGGCGTLICVKSSQRTS